MAEMPEVSAFGLLLRDYRVRERISQRRLAGLLGVAESTIARLEAGARKPPRDVTFYDRLRDVPGFTDADIAALLRSNNAPRWFQADAQPIPGDQIANPTTVHVSVGGVNVNTEIQITAGPGLLTQDDIESLTAETHAEVSATISDVVRDYLGRKAARQKRLCLNKGGVQVAISSVDDLSDEQCRTLEAALQEKVDSCLREFYGHNGRRLSPVATR